MYADVLRDKRFCQAWMILRKIWKIKVWIHFQPKFCSVRDASFSVWIEERIEKWPYDEITLSSGNTQHDKERF